jgi:hypothetical protein
LSIVNPLAAGKLTFTDPEKIREQARRGEVWGESEPADVGARHCDRQRWNLPESGAGAV